MQSAQATPKARWTEIWGYSLGEGATSLTWNGIAAYAMLYYTQALGLSFGRAALVFSLSSVWDAILDPAVGHLSDNTRSRWGRRQPYILVGGLLMAGAFYFVWRVPGFFRHGEMLFLYVLTLNVVIRTLYAFFYVPFVALGFEICTDYHQRSQLQGARSAVNMAVNFLGPALGWTIFFADRKDGREPTSVISNYLNMGIVFAVATGVFILVVVYATRRHCTDTRGKVVGTGNTVRAFLGDSREIFTDRNLRAIVTAMCVGLVGAVFVATIQMYLYVYFLHLTAHEKTVVHGGGMILFGLGALAGPLLEKAFDKQLSVGIGAAVSAVADLTAVLLFVLGVVKPGDTWVVGGHVVPVGIVFFGGCDMVNWLGIGLYMSLITSMIADVAEVDELDSGLRKDGGYAAIFTFMTKFVQSAALFIATACLGWVGFREGSDVQTAQSIHWLVLLTFGLGSLFAALVIPIALRHPVSRERMLEVKRALALRKAAAPPAVS